MLISVGVVSIFVIFLSCVSLYALLKRPVEEKQNSLTQSAASATFVSIIGTREVFAQETSAFSTNVALTSNYVASLPTETPTSTPTNLPSDCKASVISDAPIFLSPGGGWKIGSKVLRDDQVTILGRLEDDEWYPVKSHAGEGWVQRIYLQFDEKCPQADNISHFIPLINPKSLIKFDQIPVVDDTFSGNFYGWKDDAGVLYERKLERSFGNDYHLYVRAYPKKRGIYSDYLLGLANPKIAVSLKRENGDDSSYVGIAFESLTESGSNFEVHILGGNCTIKVYENDIDVATQLVQGKTDCNDDVNYIEISVDRAVLFVSVNGQGPYKISLSKDYGIGNLNFVADRTVVNMGFVVVTTPK